MGIEQAWLLKGFVLAHNAPSQMVAAADAVIEALSRGTVEITRAREPIRVTMPPPEEPAPEAEQPEHQPEATHAETDASEEPTPKKRRNFSPEVRAAAAERMKAMHARKKAEKEGGTPRPVETTPKPFTPVPADKLVRDHSGYAGRRDPNQPLLDSDWPDIKNMLNVKRMSISQVASDYDVTFGTMRSFIDTHETREEQSPGEARALSQGGA